MENEDHLLRRMQIKVLYSFDNNTTVFLSRSKTQFPVKVAQIESGVDDNQVLTLGAFDLRNCIHQVVKSSPENFKLNAEDYAVYYKDITEQPDEPFVANGIMSSLLSSSKLDLVPGRVCQNLSASILFGDKPNTASLTLEIRLKFHVIDRSEDSAPKASPQAERFSKHASPLQTSVSQQHRIQRLQQQQQQVQHQVQQQGQASAVRRRRPPPVSSTAVKATRTKSLPIFYHPPNQQISNIINADKLNVPLKYDSKSIQDRFKLAPFLSAKIIDKPSRKRRRSHVPLTPTVQTPSSSVLPQHAMRTRSMMSNVLPMVSSPINEDAFLEATDDTEYNDGKGMDEIDEEDDFEVLQDESSSPYTPQQPPYKPPTHLLDKANSAVIVPSENQQFQSLPDLEDLDSKKTHTITNCKLPDNHGLICINRNCAAIDSVAWRYFETGAQEHPHIDPESNAPFDKSVYDGMFGPLCNACYRFLRNKGFMRPEAVVKKYLQQQKYKKDVKTRDPASMVMQQSGINQSSPFSSATPQFHKFPTPSYYPSTINEVIKTQTANRQFPGSTPIGQTPGTVGDCQDLNDFIDQINNFGGPLTDIDLPTNETNPGIGVTPPMMATKCNTRVITVNEGSEDDEENKENTAPFDNAYDFDQMINSFGQKLSPSHNNWNLFGEPTPKDGNNSTINEAFEASLPQLGTFKLSPSRPQSQQKKPALTYIPSSPLITTFSGKDDEDLSPPRKARRTDTTMSYVNGHKSSPQSEIYAEETKV